MEREAQGRAIDQRWAGTYNQPRVKGLSAEENEWIDDRARELAGDKVVLRRGESQTQACHSRYRQGHERGKRDGLLQPCGKNSRRVVGREVVEVLVIKGD